MYSYACARGRTGNIPLADRSIHSGASVEPERPKCRMCQRMNAQKLTQGRQRGSRNDFIPDTSELSSIRVQRRFFLAQGYLAFLLCGIFGFAQPRPSSIHSYLLAYVFWLAIPLGCTYVSSCCTTLRVAGGVIRFGGCWRRARGRFPVMALVYVPVLFGMKYLYSWASPRRCGRGCYCCSHKHPYLNPQFFTVRWRDLLSPSGSCWPISSISGRANRIALAKRA